MPWWSARVLPPAAASHEDAPGQAVPLVDRPYRSSHDSSLEGSRFETSVPKAAGPSTKPEQFQGDRQSPKTRNGSHSRAEPEVRIHSAPAGRWYGAGGEEMPPSSLQSN